MNKNIYILCLAVISTIITGCNTKNPPATESTKLSFSIETIRQNKIRGKINTENPDAYFVSGIMDADELKRYPQDNQIIKYQLEYIDEMYNIFYSIYEATCEENDKPDYNSMFLYKGEEKVDFSYINPNTYYELLAFQVNPITHEAIGELYRYTFTTPAIDSAKVSFTVAAIKDTLRIIPSNDSPYIYTFEEQETIIDEHLYKEMYFYDMVTFYEDYGFAQTMTNRGVYNFTFAYNKRDIKPDTEYLLTIAGYNGEINTDYTFVTFYIKDNEFVISGQEVSNIFKSKLKRKILPIRKR